MVPESGIASPSKETIERFGIRLAAPLGGRNNQHWLVDSKGKQLILRRFGSRSTDDIDYEIRLLSKIAALGWPVAPVLEGPIELDGHFWCLFPFLDGNPPANEPKDQRARGHLLARLHADLAQLGALGQREGWRRCEEILTDQDIDHVLSDNERQHPEEIRILRWHLDRARERIAGLQLQNQPGIIIHGDFTPWNLRFDNGRLTGILDFELAHWDHRVGDFALSWRGKYDEIIYGYNDIAPLKPEELELLTPLWWSVLIDVAYRNLVAGYNDSWTFKKLLQRSPLMGPDAIEFQ